MPSPIGVLFVCTGNICRSPTADGVFARLVADHDLDHLVRVDSAGTHDYHPGKRPDPRTRRAAARRGYDLEHLRARVVRPADFASFDYILAMDRSNRHHLLDSCPPQYRERVRLFLSFAEGLAEDEVPDPYYGGAAGFETVLDLVEVAAAGLLAHLRERLGGRA